MLLAQALGLTVIHWVIVFIIVCAVIGIMYVLLRQFGVTIPAFIVQIFWIVVAAVIGIAAIKIVVSMW